MEDGILVLESDGGGYQLLGAVSSRDEAIEMMKCYLVNANPDTDLAPDYGVIVSRDQNGFYSRRLKISFDFEVSA